MGERILRWQVSLIKNLLRIGEIQNFKLETEFNLPEQSIIKIDCERTRDEILTSLEKKDLELMLTFFCKDYGISYKQGINEICAPFVLMTRDGLPLPQAYLCFKQFIKQNLTSMFSDNVIFYLGLPPPASVFFNFPACAEVPRAASECFFPNEPDNS